MARQLHWDRPKFRYSFQIMLKITEKDRNISSDLNSNNAWGNQITTTPRKLFPGQGQVTSLSLSGSSPGRRGCTEFLRKGCMDTLTSFLMLFPLLTVTLLCPVPGTRHSGCGTCPLVRPPAGVRTTPRTKRAVLSVVFSADNRQIVSAGRVKSIKLWNKLVQYLGGGPAGLGVQLQVLTLLCQPHYLLCRVGQLCEGVEPNQLQANDQPHHIGQTGYLSTFTMSPDGSLCASGGMDAKAKLWDLNDGKHLYTKDHQDTLNTLTFTPNR